MGGGSFVRLGVRGPAAYRAVSLQHHARPDDAQFHAHSAYLHLAVETGAMAM